MIELKPKIKNYSFSDIIILKYGMVDLVWVVSENGNLILGIVQLSRNFELSQTHRIYQMTFQ